MIEAIRPRYLKANKAGKAHILDEFIATTGYHRKYAIRVLKHGSKPRGLKKPGRRKVYQGKVVQALEQIWEIYGWICSKRLHPFLPEGIKILEQCGEINLSPQIKQLLLSMSCATIDRCLKKARFTHPQHGLSTTKPGSLLKKAIPIRTFTPWEDERPGFLEIDLVAHCGETTEGIYLNTLTATDLATGWTEVLALANKTQAAVSQAIGQLRQNLPFPLLGLDSDNGSEFINETLYRYCLLSKSPLRVLVLTRRMTRPMWNRKTGQSCVIPSVMTVWKAQTNLPYWPQFIPTYAFISTSSSRYSNWWRKNELTAKSNAFMIWPGHPFAA
jgi:hypothetical protein